MASGPVILVAEDNDDDFVLLRCAFESAGLPNRLIGVPNGADATNYLYADPPFTNRSAYPFPDLMLLDLQMPIMDWDRGPGWGQRSDCIFRSPNRHVILN